VDHIKTICSIVKWTTSKTKQKNLHTHTQYFYTYVWRSKQRSRYSDSLWAGWLRDQTSVGARDFSLLYTRPDRLRLQDNGYRGPSLVTKRPGRGVEHQFPANDEVKHVYNYNSASPLCLRGVGGDFYLPQFCLQHFPTPCVFNPLRTQVVPSSEHIKAT